MSDNNLPNLSITATTEDLRGVYANMSIIASNPNESRIDFCFNDHAAPPDQATPMHLVSRVILSHNQLVALSKALNDHIEKNPPLKSLL